MFLHFNKIPYSCTKEGILLFIKLKPNSFSNEVSGLLSEEDKTYLKITIKSKAINNSANKELIIFLADVLGIPKKDVILLKGMKSSYKQILLRNITDINLEECIGKSY